MAIAIQFFGADKVSEAADNRDCPNWAIFQGKQFLFKYEGGDKAESLDLLNQILESLKHSAAIYTIQFYEEATKIKANTPHDGSFNFKMIEEEEKQRRSLAFEAGRETIHSRLDNIEKLLMAENEEDGEEDEEEAGMSGIITGLLKEPEKLAQLIQIGKSLMGFGTPQPGGAIAGVPVADDEKISAAVAVLKRNDPKIADHLTKLAAMSEKDKATFNYLLSMLDKL